MALLGWHALDFCKQEYTVESCEIIVLDVALLFPRASEFWQSLNRVRKEEHNWNTLITQRKRTRIKLLELGNH